MKIPFTAFVITVLLAAGCTDHSINPSVNQYDTSVISPLVPGDEWIYVDSLLDSNRSLVKEMWDTVRVGLSVDRQGETWYFVSHNNNPKATDLFANRKDGYWFFSDIENAPFLSFKYPVQAGYRELTRWDSLPFSNPITVMGEIRKVTSTNELVRIESNNFNCYHYQTILFTVQNSDTVKKEIVFENYLAPGIGIVRSIMRFEESFDPKTGSSIINGSEVSTLKSYTLK